MDIDVEDPLIISINKEELAKLHLLFPETEDVGEGITLWLVHGAVALRTRLNRDN